ncbi:hypothetical protein GIB67_006791 [Kingdonia uniflora]|uniref:J domain-containing protein n=1 Tax=Kingdonia uniflora TaxID=39325 RepID=A0A7J7KZW7_9MAGN|nr:hypothetical protein GIB67_006791 [Kingdonia uniflora]
MECNKEEAVRAKTIAEKKMQTKDFVGAKKILLRAQQLHKDLENVSQMLTVCEVHCSSELKSSSSEMDWYGILQVAQTADEGSIKKQYRKLALLLHPDKNKFAGAEAAFKLIGEAQRVLSDQQKRSLYDMKRKVYPRPRQPPQPRNRNQNIRKPPVVNNNFVSSGQTQFTGVNLHQQQQQQQQQQTQPGVADGLPTFWTSCPFCSIRYQYYTNIVNRALRCQSCTKPFIAYDMNVQGGPGGPNWSQPGFPQQAFGQGGHNNLGPHSTSGTVPPRTGFQGNISNGTTPSNPSVKKANTSEVGVSKTKNDANGVAMKEDKVEDKNNPKVVAGKPNTCKKRSRRPEEESSVSCGSGSSSDANLGDITGSGLGDGRYPRRSHRQKQNVSYNENGSEDDDFVCTKKSKACGKSNLTEDQSEASMAEKALKTNEAASTKVEEGISEKAEECNTNREEVSSEVKKESSRPEVTIESKVNPGCEKNPDPEFFDVPDPDFYDFDKDRKEECFAADQMWAVYDNLDGMPRFYARVRKVMSPGFKVRITWLTTDFDDESWINWSNEELPIACGRFKHEKSEITEDINMFSHPVLWEKGPGRSSYIIYPRKGEIWALFKNWDMSWSNDPENHRNFEFEFVLVQSDYVEGSGISVAYLVKLKGFVSLFKLKKGTISAQMPPHELLRFSHRVPSYITTGTEREDVPEGYFELDPASLPAMLEGFDDLEDVEVKIKSTDAKIDGSCSKSPGKNTQDRLNSESPKTRSQTKVGTRVDEGNLKHVDNLKSSNCTVSPLTKERNSDDIETSLNADSEEGTSSLDPNEIPGAEFFDFDADRSHDKFQCGQIWALYCDLDGLPKYYARITKVEASPEFKLHVTWLEACSLPKNMVHWFNEDMPICCGTFKLTNGGNSVYTNIDSFSHQSKVVSIIKNKKFEIYPRKGEIWAVYRNFSLQWMRSDLDKCEYDMVEILEDNGSSTKMLLLGLEDGFDTVFRIQKKDGNVVTMAIPRMELLRFSHKVPAFRLMGERDGSLSGCWELDPKAIPVCLFRSN